MTHVLSTDLDAITDRYQRAGDRFADLLGAIEGATAWGAPSACDGWTVADVADHVIDTEADFLGRFEFAPVPELDGVTDRRARFAAVCAAMSQVLNDHDRAAATYDGMLGPTTFAETVDGFYTLDLVVHRWDIAGPTGLADHARLEADEMAAVRASLGSIDPEMLRMPGLFGPERDAAPDADEQERFLAWIGRG